MGISFQNIEPFINSGEPFIYQHSCVYDAMKKLKNSHSDFLIVIDDKFSIKGSVSKEDIIAFYKSRPDKEAMRREKIFNLISNKNTTVIIYQNNDRLKLSRLMQKLKLKFIAIANNPWEKKFLGFITSDDL